MTANIYLGSNQAAFDSGKKWDLAIVDPPYGIDRNGMNMGNSVFNADDKVWDKAVPDTSFFNSLFDCSGNQIIWGGNYFADLLPASRCWLYWQKDMGGDFADGELAWTSFDRVLKQFRKRSETFDRIHPTQKPVALYKWLLKNYAKEGDTILDTHGGSMSSVIACIDMGFDIDCYEKDEDYYYAAKKRILNHIQQLPLFGPAPIINFSH